MNPHTVVLAPQYCQAFTCARHNDVVIEQQFPSQLLPLCVNDAFHLQLAFFGTEVACIGEVVVIAQYRHHTIPGMNAFQNGHKGLNLLRRKRHQVTCETHEVGA